ncbi:MAG: hypothetical protein ACNA7V_12135 [Bacteroidales bacterium]
MEKSFSTSTAISLPKIRIVIPEFPFQASCDKTAVLFNRVYKILKQYGHQAKKLTERSASILGREFNKGYHKTSGVLGKYAEQFQMFIYKSLIEFFEDEETEAEYKVSQNRSDNNRRVAASVTESKNNLKKYPLSSSWVDRFLAKILIGLELDDFQLHPIDIKNKETELKNSATEKKFYYRTFRLLISKVTTFVQLTTKFNPFNLLRRDLSGSINKLI